VTEAVPSLLVVDDAAPNLVAMRALLEPLGGRLVMAQTGEEALYLAPRMDDLFAIVLDVRLPDLDGFEVVRRLRAIAETRDVPIAFMTAYDVDDDFVRKANELEIADYFAKPLESARLLAKLRTLLQLHRERQENREQAELLRAERRARHEAEGAIRAREQALEIVSHDLKNPLALIQLSVGSLAKRIADPAAIVLLRKVERAAHQMDRLIGQLLDLARVEGGTFVLQRRPEHVSNLIRQAVEQVDPLARDKRQTIDVEMEDAVTLDCDGDRIVQVLVNLLANAVKFSRVSTRIAIEARADAACIRMAVRDQGPGISAQALPRIFERYWHAPRDANGGTGLGLAIVQAFVRAHDGRIEVDTKAGEGTTFRLIFPRRDPSAAGLASP
jgi:signal transduction histidine kinase